MDMASQCGRRATDGTAELRGNGMFVRRQVLASIGGWNPRALTEDLDLSTRLSAAGHHVVLAPEAVVEEEAVETLAALWHQRLRWAEGSLRRLLEHGPGLLAGSQPLVRKADFAAFAAEFVLPPLFATTIIASLLTIALPGPADWTVPGLALRGLRARCLPARARRPVGGRGPRSGPHRSCTARRALPLALARGRAGGPRPDRDRSGAERIRPDAALHGRQRDHERPARSRRVRAGAAGGGAGRGCARRRRRHPRRPRDGRGNAGRGAGDGGARRSRDRRGKRRRHPGTARLPHPPRRLGAHPLRGSRSTGSRTPTSCSSLLRVASASGQPGRMADRPRLVRRNPGAASRPTCWRPRWGSDRHSW